MTVLVLSCGVFLGLVMIMALVLWLKEAFEKHLSALSAMNARQMEIIAALSDQLTEVRRPGASIAALSATMAKRTNQVSEEKMPWPVSEEIEEWDEMVRNGEMTPEQEAKFGAAGGV